MIWEIILGFQYVVIVIGIASQCLLLNFMVAKPALELCARTAIAILSVSIVYVLLLFGFETFVCLLTGSMFEDKICIAQLGKLMLSAAREYFQVVIVQSHLTFTIERLISIKAPNFHKTKEFNRYFNVALLLQQLFALFYTFTDIVYPSTFNFFWLLFFHIVIYTKATCRSLYKAEVQRYDLSRKHELYKSYEITKGLLNALVANAGQQVLTFLVISLQYAGLLLPKEDADKILFLLHLLWNSNFAVFSCVLLYSHRSSRIKIMAIQPKTSITSIDGTDITQRRTQQDHFQELRNAWA